jgi:hypothetical protein
MRGTKNNAAIHNGALILLEEEEVEAQAIRARMTFSSYLRCIRRPAKKP